MIETACSPSCIDGAVAVFPYRSKATERRQASDPLRGLAGSDLAGRFRHWYGVSGRRYLFSVFAVHRTDWREDCPAYGEAIVLAVARDRSGDRRILWVGQTGVLSDLLFDGDAALEAVLTAGANEVHMHLLAKDRASRDAIILDITG